MQQPCINKIFYPYSMASYFCSSRYNRLVLVRYVCLSSENLLKGRSRSACCACKLREYYYYYYIKSNLREPHQWCI
jgi:hypothetical protein